MASRFNLLHRMRARRLSEGTRLHRQFHTDPEAALKAYFLHNGRDSVSRQNYQPDMIRRAVEFKYLGWPRKIMRYVKGRDMLDVGCGTGLHAIGYLVVGVKSYTGLDPTMKLDQDRAKNLEKRRGREEFGWTPREIADALPRVTLIPGTFEDVAPDRTFDVAILHNVTEHLMNIEEVFEGVWDRLRPGGTILFHHHNYYCWNGHHQKPKFVDEIDPDDAEQKRYVDWMHLSPDAVADEWLSTRVNRIRLDELRALTMKYFLLDEWEEKLTEATRGAGRLTPEIRWRFPRVSLGEFLTQGVFCVGSKRAQPLDGIYRGREVDPPPPSVQSRASTIGCR